MTTPTIFTAAHAREQTNENDHAFSHPDCLELSPAVIGIHHPRSPQFELQPLRHLLSILVPLAMRQLHDAKAWRGDSGLQPGQRSTPR